MLLAAIVRFANIQSIEKFSGVALTLYIILFGVILICTEASYKNFRQWFYFLNFGWGKAVADLFIVSIVLGSGAAVKWCDVLVAIWLFAMAIFLPLITFCYKEDEVAMVD